MTRGVSVLALAAVLALAGEANAALEPCSKDGTDRCAQLTVPLDRSGGVLGTLRLDVERSGPVKGATEPPVIAIGGVPGQISQSSFDPIDLGFAIEGFDRPRGPGREVILMDLRGTGAEPLRCEALERAIFEPATTDAAAKCAAELGTRRGLFTAGHSAHDVESLRQALGVERIALVGGAYGAQVALAYARLYPSRVERMVLQSPPAPQGPDLLLRSTFAAIPGAIRSRCGKGFCRAASRTPVQDVVALAQRLERDPVSGPVIVGSGRTRQVTMNGEALFEALVDNEFSPFSVTEGSDVVGLARSARRGDLAPLLRAQHIAGWYRGIYAGDRYTRYFSPAAYAASICEESQLPWPRTAPVEDRPAHVSSLVAGQPATTFHPFGPRTALGSDLVELCLRWPVASPPPEPPRSLPAIPTLVFASLENIAAPISDARAVANLIPGARLLAVPGSGPDASLFLGSCTGDAMHDFFAGRSPADCGRARFSRRPSAAPPLSIHEVERARGLRGRVARTVQALRLTLRDGAGMLEARFFSKFLAGPMTQRSYVEIFARGVRTGALRRGTYAMGRRRRFALHRASYVPGVTIDGTVSPDSGYEPKRRGALRVRGTGAVDGTLVVRGKLLVGRLGGQDVRVRLGPAAFPDVTIGR